MVLKSLLLIAYVLVAVEGHGRMVEPPGRNTMWRLDYPTAQNYDDTELFCGGLKVTYQDNGGRCGVCGDNFALKRPRPHETGGNFTSDTTSRTYQPGRVLDVVIELVANHKGWFEFTLCERNDPTKYETEECFNNRLLQLDDDTGTRFHIPNGDNGYFVIPVKLPKDVSCTHCVFRWHWRAGNNWGDCDNETKAVGCGPQELYRNCADISVLAGAGIRGSYNSRPRPRPNRNLRKFLRVEKLSKGNNHF